MPVQTECDISAATRARAAGRKWASSDLPGAAFISQPARHFRHLVGLRPRAGILSNL